jgi:hypothetical protein
VIRFANGSNWLNLWTPSIHDDTIQNNYSDTATFNNNGTNITFQQATVVTGGQWPAAALAIIAAAGPAVPPPATADDDDLRVTYSGTWSSSGSRGDGDLDNGVHYTTTNGNAATITFTGTSITFLTETNSDEGTIGVTLDGASKGTINANSASRSAQQHLYTAGGLVAGTHTLTVSKMSGTYLLVDGFSVG